jgi:hypothetical protein
MTQAVSRLPLTAEARGFARINPCGICRVQSGTGTGFLWVLPLFPANIIPPWLSVLIYHLGDEQWARWWSQPETLSHPIDMNNSYLVARSSSTYLRLAAMFPLCHAASYTFVSRFYILYDTEVTVEGNETAQYLQEQTSHLGYRHNTVDVCYKTHPLLNWIRTYRRGGD